MKIESLENILSKQNLYNFLKRAIRATYAGGGEEVKSERQGFIELATEEGDHTYRDSYTGYFRSRGMEVVRYKGTPIWTSMYGGGMFEGKEKYAHETFEFLKKALFAEEPGFISFRGPHEFIDGDWKHTYTQEGDINEFWGYEEISFKNEPYFYHRIIGGNVLNKL